MPSYSATLVALLVSSACGGRTLDIRETSTGGSSGLATRGEVSSGATSAGAGGTQGSGATTGGSETSGGTTGASTGGGGSAPLPTCGNAADPCGGDEVGRWRVVPSCLDVSGEVDIASLGLGCLSAPVTGTLEVSGTLVLDAKGTLTDNTVTTGESEIFLSAQCLQVDAPEPVLCSRLEPVISSLGYTRASCVAASDGGCTCSTTLSQTGAPGFVSPDATWSGSFETSSDVLKASYLSEVQYGYCVDGNTMTLVPPRDTLTGTVAGAVVLVR